MGFPCSFEVNYSHIVDDVDMTDMMFVSFIKTHIVNSWATNSSVTIWLPRQDSNLRPAD
ncbi:uncharacterized protein METZ01_LOCUS94754 [marine metagenome]|uniref:Uncharacterized protein n=1 Tax=marine metagenome TaxID=408172 RepID=A0A381VNL3_9ZZZZ